MPTRRRRRLSRSSQRRVERRQLPASTRKREVTKHGRRGTQRQRRCRCVEEPLDCFERCSFGSAKDRRNDGTDFAGRDTLQQPPPKGSYELICARRATRACHPCPICPSCQSAARISSCAVGQITTMLSRIPPRQEGRYGRFVTKREVGCGGRGSVGAKGELQGE
jgi:hypothetical protein